MWHAAARRGRAGASTGWPGRQVQAPREELPADSGPEPPGQREPALQGTGRLNNPARSPARSRVGWTSRPATPDATRLTSQPTPAPVVDAPGDSHALVESESLSRMR